MQSEMFNNSSNPFHKWINKEEEDKFIITKFHFNPRMDSSFCKVQIDRIKIQMLHFHQHLKEKIQTHITKSEADSPYFLIIPYLETKVRNHTF